MWGPGAALHDAPPRQARHHRLGAGQRFRGQTDTLRKMSDRVEHCTTSSIGPSAWTCGSSPHGDLRMDGPQCLLEGVAPKRCALPQGMPADRRSQIRGIPDAWQRWRAGAVLEAAAGGGGARAEGRRHWWWRFRAGGAAACGESGVHGTAASGAAEPAACCRRRISGGRWRCCRWCPSICCCDGQGRYLTGLRIRRPRAPGSCRRASRNEPLALALDRIAREELGLRAMAAAWTPCGVHSILLHQLRRRNQPLHPLHRAGPRPSGR